MAQLREIKHVWQKEPGVYKRWFTDDDFWDIYVWLDPQQEIIGVQICYNKFSREKAITWIKNKVFDHTQVNSHYRDRSTTPILVPEDDIQHQDLLGKFINDSRDIEQRIVHFIIRKFDEFKSIDTRNVLYSDFASNEKYLSSD